MSAQTKKYRKKSTPLPFQLILKTATQKDVFILPLLTTEIFWDCFYLLIFHSEKFST